MKPLHVTLYLIAVYLNAGLEAAPTDLLGLSPVEYLELVSNNNNKNTEENILVRQTSVKESINPDGSVVATTTRVYVDEVPHVVVETTEVGPDGSTYIKVVDTYQYRDRYGTKHVGYEETDNNSQIKADAYSYIDENQRVHLTGDAVDRKPDGSTQQAVFDAYSYTDESEVPHVVYWERSFSQDGSKLDTTIDAYKYNDENGDEFEGFVQKIISSAGREFTTVGKSVKYTDENGIRHTVETEENLSPDGSESDTWNIVDSFEYTDQNGIDHFIRQATIVYPDGSEWGVNVDTYHYTDEKGISHLIYDVERTDIDGSSTRSIIDTFDYADQNTQPVPA